MPQIITYGWYFDWFNVELNPGILDDLYYTARKEVALTSSSIHEKTIYGVNVMGAIRKLFSYWFSLKWEENGVFWRLLMLTFFFFSPLFSASLPFSLSSFIVNRNRFQNTEFFNVFRFKNSDPCKGSQKNPQAICYFKSVISEYSN